MKTLNNNLEILLFSATPPPIGGISSWTLNFIEEQNSKGNNIILINTSKKKYSKIKVLNEILRFLKILKNTIFQINKNNIDLVHINTACSTNGMIRELIIIKLIKFYKKKKIVLHCHCDVSKYINKRNIRVFKKICNKSDALFVLNSQSLKYIKDIGINSHIYLVDNFINNKKIINTNKINTYMKNILYIGRITKEKGCYELLEAAKLKKNLNFYFVGKLESDFNENDFNNIENVNYLGEKKSEEIYDLMSKNDVLVLPSYAEGFPMVILEAMFAGLPIISTKVGSINDMLKDDGCVYIEIASSSSIIEALDKIKNKKIRENISRRNIEFAKQHYSSNNVVDNINNIYLKILNNKK